MTTIVASAARTASGASSALAMTNVESLRYARFVLDVTAAGTLAADTLDVFVQQSIDGGVTYDDVVHFTQVLGNGGAVKHIAEWQSNITPEADLHAPADGTFAVGVRQGGLLTPPLRAKWTIVNGGGTHAFTFSITMQGLR